MVRLFHTNKNISQVCFDLFTKVAKFDHEQVLICQDNHTGLKAIIAIHNTQLGPALGGTRMWAYSNEAEALTDVLRLSRGMSYKAAITGLNLGGGKAVIIGDAKTQKSEALMRRFGKFVDGLSGRYITAEDVNVGTKDMEYIAMETRHVTGLPEFLGGGGDPSPVTAYGVYLGYLAKENAIIYVNDINEDNLKAVAAEYKVQIVDSASMFDLDIDIYAPCALGATINDASLERLRCSIIAGAANNQLADETIHGLLCQQKGILYAPDFLINAGGLINVSIELEGYNRDRAMRTTENIYASAQNVFRIAKAENISTNNAAKRLAEKRMEEIGRIKLSF